MGKELHVVPAVISRGSWAVAIEPSVDVQVCGPAGGVGFWAILDGTDCQSAQQLAATNNSGAVPRIYVL